MMIVSVPPALQHSYIIILL